jgi:branched-chain amino acid transport system substrate-binding protein
VLISRKAVTLAVSVSAVMLSVAACGSTSAPSGGGGSAGSGGGAAAGPLKIGVMSDSTGSLAFFGQRANQGWDLALASIGGKIADREVQFIKVQCATPAECTTATTRVVKEQGAEMILGTPGSALALAISQEAARLKVVYFETGALANSLLPAGDAKYIFRGGPDETILQASVKDALTAAYQTKGMSLSGAKVLLVNESTAANHNAADIQKKELADTGINLLGQEEYDAKSADFGAIAAKIASQNPDVLIGTSYIADGVALNKQLNARNYRPKMHIISATPSPKDQLDGLGAAYLKDILQITYPSLDVKTTGDDGIQKFLDAYKAKYGTAPDSAYALTYYSGAKVLFAVLKTSGGKADPESFLAAVKKTDLPAGSIANGWGVKFDAHGQNTLGTANVVQWQNGAVCTVLPVSEAACKMQFGG